MEYSYTDGMAKNDLKRYKNLLDKFKKETNLDKKRSLLWALYYNLSPILKPIFKSELKSKMSLIETEKQQMEVYALFQKIVFEIYKGVRSGEMV